MKIKIATYNICHCADYTDYKGDTTSIEKTSNLIKKIDADVITLNEVYNKGDTECFVNQASKIAKLCNYEYFYYSKGEEFEWNDEIGNAILSKYPLEDIEVVNVIKPKEDERNPLENEWYEDRVIIKATICASEKIDVITTHFGLNNLEQIKMISSLKELISKSKNKIIITGDFNNEPDSPKLNYFYENFISAQNEMNNNDYTFSSFEPRMILDYIFVDKSIEIENFEVIKEIVSDHFPIVAELKK